MRSKQPGEEISCGGVFVDDMTSPVKIRGYPRPFAVGFVKVRLPTNSLDFMTIP